MSRSEETLKNGSYGQLLLNLSLPSVMIILVMIIYNVADTFFIGQTGDPNKIAAISLSMPIFTILSGIGSLFGQGGATTLSIALGQNDSGKIRRITTFCTVGCTVIGIAFMLAVFFLTTPIARYLGAEESTMDLTVTYLRTFALCCPFVLLSQAYGNMMRADGSGGLAMIPNISGTITNIILDALFILVFKWDVFGAALATVLGNMLSAFLAFFLIYKKKQYLRPALNTFTLNPEISVPVLTLGLPMTLSTIMGSVAGTLQNRLMIAHGTNALAAQSVAGKVNMMVTMLLMGICMGLQPAISYNYGAKNFKRMYEVVKKTAIFTIAVGILLTIFCYFFKDRLVAAFIDNAEIISMGQTFVLASVVIGPIYGIFQTCQTFMQSTGKVTFAIFSSTLDKFLLYIPVLYVMNHFFGAYGIAFSHAVTMVITILVALGLALKWAHDIR